MWRLREQTNQREAKPMTHASHYTETFECTEREEQECGSLSKYSEGH